MLPGCLMIDAPSCFDFIFSSPIKQKKAVRQHKKSVVTSPKLSTVKIHTSETRSITLHDVKGLC